MPHIRDARYFLTSKTLSQAVAFLTVHRRQTRQYGQLITFSLALSLTVSLLSQPLFLFAATPTKTPVKAAPKSAPASSASIETLVNKAQNCAENEQFGEAIPLYEQLLQKLPASDPNHTVLARNLEVLYVNQSVILIGKKQYDPAEALLLKAQSKYPNNVHAKQTLATLYFRKAMDLRDEGQANPETWNFEAIEKLMKQALAIEPNNGNFKRGLSANYFDNGLEFAHQQKFMDAIPLLESARQLQPTNDNIKDSLVNVYLSQMQQETDTAKQKAWGDKALALDNSADTQSTVQSILNPPSATDVATTDPKSGALVGDKKPKMPASGAKLSVQDMMLDIENQWGIERDSKAKLADRLAFAEKQINGKESEGPLATRIQGLYAQLYGQQPQAIDPTAGPVNLSEDALKNSYIAEVFKMTDGKVIRFGKFPVRVFVEEPNEKTNAKDLDGLYKPEYKQAVLDGIRRWQEASHGSISFVEVKSMSAADIIFDFNKAYVDRFADADKVPDWYKHYSAPKVNNKMMTAVQLASMFTPGFFSLIPMAVGSSMQYQRFKKLEVIREESTVHLGLEPIVKLPQEQSITLLQNIAAKEFGHALGIKATSPDPKDLMYPDLVSDHAKFPTNRDIATFTQIYTRPANILLNVQSQITGRY